MLANSQGAVSELIATRVGVCRLEMHGKTLEQKVLIFCY